MLDLGAQKICKPYILSNQKSEKGDVENNVPKLQIFAFNVPLKKFILGHCYVNFAHCSSFL